MTRPNKQLIKDLVSIVSRLVLAVTFIWASIHKIADPYDFSLQVATYQILPLALINLQGIILPWLELFCGLLLLSGFWTRSAALLTCGMNIMFIVAIGLALQADLHLQCGCFTSSTAGEEMTGSLIIRDALLLAVGVFLVWVKPDRLTFDALLERRKIHA